MENKIEDGKEDEQNNKNRLKHAEFKKFLIKAKSISPLLGGAIADSKTCVKHGLKQLNAFERNCSEKNIVLPARWFRAMMREGARLIDEGSVLATYIYTFDTTLKNPEISIMPINSNPIVMGKHQGKGAVNFEAIIDCVIDVEMVIPVKHIGVNKAKEWITKSFAMEGTGAFRKGFGRFEVTEIKVKSF